VPVCLRILAASGTIESLRSRFRPKKVPKTKASPENTGEGTGVAGAPVQPECMFAKKSFQIVHCNGQKVDVIEKGFKNTNRLFLTKDDLENLNATTISDRI
jgi:hypothetical protein